MIFGEYLKNIIFEDHLSLISLKLPAIEMSDNNLKYRNIIGTLLYSYIATGTRPDISYSTLVSMPYVY